MRAFFMESKKYQQLGMMICVAVGDCDMNKNEIGKYITSTLESNIFYDGCDIEIKNITII